MNMLGIAVLDFIDHLRNSIKGWQIEPMVLHYNHGGYVQLLRPLINQSPTTFFIDRMNIVAKTRIDEICCIKIKFRKKSLRFIKCEMVLGDLVLSYWTAEGWKQTGDLNNLNNRNQSHRAGPIFRPDFIYNVGPVFRLSKIIRVTKGRRNRGRKSPGSDSVTHIDKIVLNDPSSAGRVAKMTIATIMKSYEATKFKTSPWRTRAIVLDGADFDFITAYGFGATPVYYS